MTTETTRLSDAMLDMLDRENQGDGLAILSRVETRTLIAEVRASRASPEAPTSGPMVVGLAADRVDCIDCGLGVRCDEDGLCSCCGRAVVMVENGVPDYQHVKAGMEAEEEDADRMRKELAARASPEEGRAEAEKAVLAAVREWTRAGLETPRRGLAYQHLRAVADDLIYADDCAALRSPAPTETREEETTEEWLNRTSHPAAPEDEGAREEIAIDWQADGFGRFVGQCPCGAMWERIRTSETIDISGAHIRVCPGRAPASSKEGGR